MIALVPARQRRVVLALGLGAALAGCGRSIVRTCPGAPAPGDASGGRVAAPAVAAAADPTAGGRLQRRTQARSGGARRMVLLIDYSGSMYPGYGKVRQSSCRACAADMSGFHTLRNGQSYYVATPDFQELLAGWLDAALPAAQPASIEVLLFNRRLRRLGNDGLEEVVAGNGASLPFDHTFTKGSKDQIETLLRRIPPSPYYSGRDPKQRDDAPDVTDTPAALRTTVAMAHEEEIVWLITDNIVDTGHTPIDVQDASLTRAFYRQLVDEPRVQMVAAYPLFLSDPCKWMCGTSLFLYGLYVSPFERPSGAELRRIGGTTPEGSGPAADGWLWDPALRDLAAGFGTAAERGRRDMAGVPLRLKPIDTDVLAITMEGPSGEPAVACDPNAKIGQPVRCAARLRIRNTLRHQRVAAAALTLDNDTLVPRRESGGPPLPWAAPVCPGSLTVLAWAAPGGPVHRDGSPIRIGPLAPLQQADLEVEFELPPTAVDTASRSTLLQVAFTNRILLEGTIHAAIRNVSTDLVVDPTGFENVYGARDLPEIFRHREESSAAASFELTAAVANNGQLLALLAILFGGSLAGLVALVGLRFQRRQFTVAVDGVDTARVSLPRWSGEDLQVAGAVRARLWRGWGAGYRVIARGGARLRRDGAVWVVTPRDEGDEHRLQIRRGWGSAPTGSRSLMEDW